MQGGSVAEENRAEGIMTQARAIAAAGEPPARSRRGGQIALELSVLHELDIVRRAFPRTLLLARECIFWGDTRDALCQENLLRARAMSEAYDEGARECLRDNDRDAGDKLHVH